MASGIVAMLLGAFAPLDPRLGTGLIASGPILIGMGFGWKLPPT